METTEYSYIYIYTVGLFENQGAIMCIYIYTDSYRFVSISTAKSQCTHHFHQDGAEVKSLVPEKLQQWRPWMTKNGGCWMLPPLADDQNVGLSENVGLIFPMIASHFS